MPWSPQLQSREVRKSNEFVRFFDIPDTPPPPHLPLERFAVLILKSSAGRQNFYLKNPLKESLKDFLKDSLKDSLKEFLKDFLKDSLKDSLKDFLKDFLKDSVVIP